jgi:hypothetical protein
MSLMLHVTSKPLMLSVALLINVTNALSANSWVLNFKE